MIIVTGSVTARDDSFDALREACLAHVHRSRTEDGCISHSVQLDCEDPLKLVFFEEWRDLESLHVHFSQPGTREFLGAVRAHAASSVPVTTYSAEKTPAQ